MLCELNKLNKISCTELYIYIYIYDQHHLEMTDVSIGEQIKIICVGFLNK